MELTKSKTSSILKSLPLVFMLCWMTFLSSCIISPEHRHHHHGHGEEHRG